MDGSVYLSFLHHILCFPAQGGGLVGGQVAELGCHGLHPQQLRGPCGLHPGRRVSRGGKGWRQTPTPPASGPGVLVSPGSAMVLAGGSMVPSAVPLWR